MNQKKNSAGLTCSQLEDEEQGRQSYGVCSLFTLRPSNNLIFLDVYYDHQVKGLINTKLVQ